MKRNCNTNFRKRLVVSLLLLISCFYTFHRTSAFSILPKGTIGSNPTRKQQSHQQQSLSTSGSTSTSSSSSYHFFRIYGWADAFKNDSSLGKVDNPGLKNGPKYNEQVTVNGINVPGAVTGQKLTVVANKVRVKIPVNCQKGDCGTCIVSLNGRKVKACQTQLPAGKAVIQTL